MRTRQLEILHAVLQAGSISAAARQLHLSQPAVTKIVRQAEQSAGLRFFEREGKRIVPTQAAQALYPLLQEWQQRAVSLERAAQNLARDHTNWLRVAAVPALAASFVPQVCAQLSSKNLSVSISSGHHDELAARLFERGADVALAFDPPPHPLLRIEQMQQLHLVVAAQPKLLGRFAKAPGQALDAQSLKTMRLIALDGRDPLGMRYGQLAQAHDLPPARWTVQTYLVGIQMAKEGLGVAVVDSLSAQRFGQDLVVRPVVSDLVASATQFPLSAMCLAGLELPPATQAFIAACKQCAQSLR